MTSTRGKREVVGVNTPISNYAEIQDPYSAVLIGNDEYNPRPITTTNYGTFGATFNAISVPNVETFVDRNFILGVKYEIIGVATPSLPDICPLQTGFDAPRAMALNKSIESINLNINGTTFTSKPTDYIQELMRFNRTAPELDLDFSGSAAMLDNSQEYSETANTNRNPLAKWGDNPAIMPRGAVEITNVVNPKTGDPATSTVFSFDMMLREPLAISPCLQNMERSVGFYGVESLELQITFKNNLARYLWSHNPANTVPLSFKFTSIKVVGAQLEMAFASPLASEKRLNRGREIIYPYYQLRSFIKTETSAVGIGDLAQITGQSVSLATIPRKVFVFVREKDADKTMEHSDAYFRIEGLSLDFGNKTGMFASATPHQLYKTAVRNGYSGTYHDWYGSLTYECVGSTLSTVAGVGSIAAFSFGSDIPLGRDMAVGMMARYNFQPHLSIRNMNPNRSITPEIVIVVSYDGEFTIGPDGSRQSLATVTQKEALKVLLPTTSRIAYENYTSDVIGGSKVGDWFKKAGKTFWDIFKIAGPAVLPILGKMLGGSAVPDEYDEDGKKKKKKGSGVGMVGGKAMTQSSFRKSLIR